MTQTDARWPSGDGEMAARLRGFAWTATPLGPIASWPERLKLMIEQVLASPLVASLVCGPERILIYNDAAARLYGDRHPAALGVPLPQTFPEGWATVGPLYDRVFAGETVEVIAQPLDLAGAGAGSAVFDAVVVPVRDAAGNVAAGHMTGQEVGARVRAEARVRESEERFRAFVTASSDVVYRMSPDWSQMRQLDGRGFLVDTAEPNEAWMDHYIHADDQAHVRLAIDEAIARRSMFELEHRVRRADGTLGWTLSRAVPILDEAGAIREWLGAATDVTERVRTVQALRESEVLRRVALAGGRMGTWRWDLDERLIWGDPQFLALWGFPPSDDPHPLSRFTDRMSADGAAEMEVIVTKAIEADEEFDGSLKVASGPTAGRWIRWRGRADRDVRSVLYGVTFDITDQRHAETALRDSEERQAFLLKLSDALRPVTDASDAQRVATCILGERLGAHRALYFEVAADGDGLEAGPSYVRGAGPMPGPVRLSHLAAPVSQSLRGGRTVVIDDARTDAPFGPEFAARAAAVELGAVIGVPLLRGTRLVAVLAVHHAKARAWTGTEVALAEAVAERTRAAVERARAEAALRESEQRLAADLADTRALQDAGAAMIEDLRDNEAEVRILSAAVAIMRSDAASLQMLDPDSGELVLLGQVGFAPDAAASWQRVDGTSGGISGRAIRQRARVVVDVVEGEATPSGGEQRVLRLSGIVSVQTTPLITRSGRIIGMMSTHWRARHRPGARALGHFDVLARQAADLIERRFTQAALRESEERLRLFGEASSDVLWIRDAETFQWTYLTPAFETIYGVERGTALSGDNMAGWIDLIALEDRVHAVESLRRVRAGERVSFEYRIRRPRDGAIRWLRNTDFPMRDAGGAVRWIGGIGRDITEEKETAARMDVLVAELQHRTRNLMSVVRSMADKTMARSADLADFRERYGDRLAALARVQGLLSRLDEWDRVTFDELIRAELSALDGDTDRITLAGPEGVALRSSTVQTFALALHELMTNALKYGALAQPQGRLDVRWRVGRAEADGRPWLHVDWRERGVPMPAVGALPRGGGSGRELIERALPYQLGARTTYVMERDGVHCSIALPISERQRARELANV